MASDSNKSAPNPTDKMNLKRGGKYIALSNLMKEG